MRVSVYKDDPGYPQFSVAKAHGKTVHAFLDGVEVRFCVTADDEKNFVLAAVLTTDGNVQLDPHNPDCVWQEERTGNVRIEFRDRVSIEKVK